MIVQTYTVIGDKGDPVAAQYLRDFTDIVDLQSAVLLSNHGVVVSVAPVVLAIDKGVVNARQF